MNLSVQPGADHFLTVVGAHTQTRPAGTYVGIDVSKALLEVYVDPCAERLSAGNDEDGIGEITQYLHEMSPELIVLEASGGLEVRVAVELAAKGLPIVIIDPRQARNYALASGQISQCGSVGADVLSRFARLIRNTVVSLSDNEIRSLEELLSRRRVLSEIRLKERSRLSDLSWVGQKSLLAHINWLDRCCVEIDADLAKRLRASPVWRAREDLLKRIAVRPGQRHAGGARVLFANGM